MSNNPAEARFKIGDRIYSTAALDEISLRDLVVFNTEVAELGLPYTWADVERIGNEMADLEEEAAKQHPDAMFITGVTIWASRRAAGDQVSFLEAIDVKLKDLQFVPPKEEAPRTGPTKTRKAKSGRKGSSRVAPATPSLETPGRETTTSETSESRSVTA